MEAGTCSRLLRREGQQGLVRQIVLDHAVDRGGILFLGHLEHPAAGRRRDVGEHAFRIALDRLPLGRPSASGIAPALGIVVGIRVSSATRVAATARIPAGIAARVPPWVATRITAARPASAPAALLGGSLIVILITLDL